MAGTISLSLTQQFDALGNVLAGGKLYIIQAGTVATPQNSYQDSALTIPWANPIILSAAGRLPQFFLTDGSIKVRLTDADGVDQFVADGLLVVGASSGGGGGSPVDATTVYQTGDLKARYGTGVHTGFVRLNGRSIGSVASGATERANADTQTLYEFLWNADANLGVSAGRGASANADWLADKRLSLPDWRGRALGFLDDMGNTAAGRLTVSYFGTAATALGAAGGLETSQLIAANQLPNVNFTGNTSGLTVPASYTNLNINGLSGGTVTGVANGTLAVTPTVSVNSGGSSTAFKTVSPMMLATLYIKL